MDPIDHLRHHKTIRIQKTMTNHPMFTALLTEEAATSVYEPLPLPSAPNLLLTFCVSVLTASCSRYVFMLISTIAFCLQCMDLKSVHFQNIIYDNASFWKLHFLTLQMYHANTVLLKLALLLISKQTINSIYGIRDLTDVFSRFQFVLLIF